MVIGAMETNAQEKSWVPFGRRVLLNVLKKKVAERRVCYLYLHRAEGSHVALLRFTWKHVGGSKQERHDLALILETSCCFWIEYMLWESMIWWKLWDQGIKCWIIQEVVDVAWDQNTIHKYIGKVWAYRQIWSQN